MNGVLKIVGSFGINPRSNLQNVLVGGGSFAVGGVPGLAIPVIGTAAKRLEDLVGRGQAENILKVIESGIEPAQLAAVVRDNAGDNSLKAIRTMMAGMKDGEAKTLLQKTMDAIKGGDMPEIPADVKEQMMKRSGGFIGAGDAPIKAYHGTDSATYQTFDPSKAAKGDGFFNPLGDALYTSTNRDFAKTFGKNVMEGHLPRDLNVITLGGDKARNVARSIGVQALKKAGMSYDKLELGKKVEFNRLFEIGSPIENMNALDDFMAMNGVDNAQEIIRDVTTKKFSKYDGVRWTNTDYHQKADEIALFSDRAKKAFLGQPDTLPKDTASRMARAREMGFDVDNPVYHGTDAKAFEAIQKNGFDIGKTADGGVWFTTNKGLIDGGEVGAAGNGKVIQAYIKGKKWAGWDEADNFGTDELIQKGYDGLKLVEDGQTTYKVFDPKNIRSVNAMFDPAKKDSANLLAARPEASLVAGGLAAGAATQGNSDELGNLINEMQSPDPMGDLIKSLDKPVNKPQAAKGVSPDIISKIAMVESSNNPNAKASTSSATGLHQMTAGTWLSLAEKYEPSILKGRSKADVLRMRKDPKTSERFTSYLISENSKILRKNGAPVNDTSVYLAHFAGGETAADALTASPDTPVEEVFSKAQIRANRNVLKDKTVGEVVKWAEEKMKRSRVRYVDAKRKKSA